MQSLNAVKVVEAVIKAIKRIPKKYVNIFSFFSDYDIWDYEAIMDKKTCVICRGHEISNMHVIGSKIRLLWPFLHIIDLNTIGGPGPNNTGLSHPNCRCRLHRTARLKEPEEEVPTGFGHYIASEDDEK